MRRFRTAATCTAVLAVLLTLAAFSAAAVCFPTVYNVTSSAPPPTGNWTDTSGAVWTPAGGFPGCALGDSAIDLNASPTTLIINSSIPNPLSSLNLACNGCVIDIQSGGSLTLAGPATIGSGATLKVGGGGSLTIANGGNLTMQSGSTFLASGSVDIQTGGQLTLPSSVTTTINGTFSLSGGTLTVPPSATAAFQTQFYIYGGTANGGGTITNSGFLQMNGTATISDPFNNLPGGVLDVAAGTLSLAAGGTGDAPFTIQSGATLDFPSGSYAMTPNGTVSGAGTLQISGGTLSIGGVTSPNGYYQTAGTLTGPGFLTVNSSFTWSGGTITGTGGTQIAGTAIGNFDGAVSTMVLDGRAFDEYGAASLSATANTLDVVNGAAFTIYGTFQITDDGSIGGDTASSLTISPNGVMMKSGGTGTSTISPKTYNNATVWVFSGTLNFAGSGTHNGFFDAFTNATLRFSAANSTMTSSSFVGATTDGTVAFTNAGSTTLQGSYQNDGLTSVTSSSSVDFVTGGYTWDLSLDSGFLKIEDDFHLKHTGTWSGGTVDIINDAEFTVDSGATLNITGSMGSLELSSGELLNQGTMTYTAPAANPLTFNNGADIDNDTGGVFDLQNDTPIVNAVIIVGSGPQLATKQHAVNPRHKRHIAPNWVPTANFIYNDGTLKKTGGSGTQDLQPSVENDGTVLAQSGTMQFSGGYMQGSGVTTLGPGNIKMVSQAFELDGGTLDGAGTITGDVSNTAGVVAPGGSGAVGTINVSGNYTQSTATPSLNIELASNASYDVLAVGGSSTLDGTLNVSLISGYLPANGDAFQPHTFASRTGDFAVKNLPTWSGGLGTMSSSYTPTALVLTASVAASADLYIAKSGPAGVSAGQNVVYTVTVTNYGPSPAAGVIVSDPTPANLTFVSNSGACTSAYPCSLGTMASGQTLTITSTYSTSPSFAGTVTNTATVSSSTVDTDSTNNSATASTNVGAQADLSITKSGPASANTGQTISYTVVVSNAGPSAAVSTVVSDPTPAGVAFVSNSGACTTPYPCSLGTLNAGQTVSITSTYTIPGSYSAPQVVNTANVSSSTSDPNPGDNSSTATTNVALAADVVITKSGPTSATAGQNVTYTIVTTNAGPSAAAAVVVNDPTPAGLTFVGNTGGCVTTYPCNLGNLAPGQTVTISTTFNIPIGFASPSFTNTASATSGASDPNTGNNSSSVTTTVAPSTPQADLSIAKSGPAATNTNQNIVYSIAVTNNGPLPATGVVVSDPTPAGLTFVSNTGACTTPFPCSIGSLSVGQTATITATFNVPAGYPGATITNSASATATSADNNLANNTATATTNVTGASAADVTIFKHAPDTGYPGRTVDYILDVFNNGPSSASNVIVTDPTPAGLTFVSNSGACTTPFPCNLGTLAAGANPVIIARYRVTAAIGTVINNTATVSTSTSDPNGANNTSQGTFTVTAPPPCPTGKPQLTAPAEGTTVGAPVALSWNGVVSATNYSVNITGPTSLSLSTDQTSASANLPNGNYTWSVTANFAQPCGSTTSATGHFTVCNTPDAPVASVVGESTTGQTYAVTWTPAGDGNTYELQEAGDFSFSNPTSFTVTGNSRSFTKSASVATAYFYRVRAVSCGSAPFSHVMSVVVVPLPKPNDPRFNVSVPDGSTTPVVFQIFIPGLPGGPASFIATTDKPWIGVIPQAGVVPPEGMNVTVSLDPSSLVNGTWTGTVLVVYTTPGSGKIAGNVTQTTSIPVSISLVTPVTPGKQPSPTDNTLVIPTVGHLFGVDSQWQSDIRIANVTSSSAKYLVTFTSGDPNTPVKQTTLTIAAGATTALDDVVRGWFGVGSLANSANGLLYIQATDAAGRILSTRVTNDVTVSKTTAVSSRTYNTNAASNSPGTLGQFVPATAFANFIGKAGGAASASSLSLQQIAQNDAFRTNFGLVEASGKAVTLNLGVFDAAGVKLLDFPLSVGAGEQKQLNAFLAQNNISLSNGRLQVDVTGGDGRVQGYASIIDAKSGDPFLVSGSPLGGSASNYVVPAVGDLNLGTASWRSDVRIFNAGAAPQTTTLTYYPNGEPSNSATKSVTVNPGEVKALDSIVQSLFGRTNTSGTLHVTTATESPLIVTARTFDQTPEGTLGQFIPAVTNSDAVGRNDRSLQILQAEESVHYRTNLGVAEITGKPVTLEVSVFLPDSKVIPRVLVALGANESRQLSILKDLGIGAAYNARLAVRVTDGDGKVTAYGSVVDMVTQAPTYIPAQ